MTYSVIAKELITALYIVIGIITPTVSGRGFVHILKPYAQ